MNKTNKPNVIAILYPGCIFFELALAIELLAEKYQIIFATPDGTDHHASNGTVLTDTIPYNQIDLSNCHAILVPGGDVTNFKDNPEIDKVIQSANSQKILMAAICLGPIVLTKAKIMSGKKIAHGFTSTQIELLNFYFKDVHMSDEKIICDGHFITAKPSAHIDFAVEIACRLNVVDAKNATRIKDYYRGILGQKIRPLALALIKNSKKQYLLHRGHDKTKDEYFYRPLGGGIEFSETGKMALEREIKEEINQDITVSELQDCYENIFTYEGQKGHEIVMLYSAEFKNKSVYQQQELDIYESGVVIGKAVWRSVAEIKAEGAMLYPSGLEDLINGQ